MDSSSISNCFGVEEAEEEEEEEEVGRKMREGCDAKSN